MTTPRWYNALEQAVTQNSNSSLFQLATIDQAGEPHVRSHIHRAFLVPSSNPGVPLLITSTDVRTPKFQQMTHTSTVELAWWIDATSDQFRISGLAHLFPAPEHAPGIDWEAKRRELFDALSEGMRAAWCRPTPGTPLQGGYEQMDDWPVRVPKSSEAKTEKEKDLVKVALVDWVQMAIKPNRRTFFTRDGGDWKEQPVVP
ncbi:pyridoxamine 5'-phosphate oxidase-domain-containing protein [Lactifluus volemus]|nr:pyridoxamine 5'-phosphate oxidase-domain-containing protein [Lactifluus volemus]